jgi:hypothetical protein
MTTKNVTASAPVHQLVGRMTRCGNARRYKGKQEPTCGCDMCRIIFMVKESERRCLEGIRRVDAAYGDWL